MRPSTPLTGAGGRSSRSNPSRTNGAIAADTTTELGGARLETRAARLAPSPYTSIMNGVEIDNATVHAYPYGDADAETAPCLLAEGGDCARDFQ